jgi:1,4-dihydroxy-2-naphthoyl-CoA synthase
MLLPTTARFVLTRSFRHTTTRGSILASNSNSYSNSHSNSIGATRSLHLELKDSYANILVERKSSDVGWITLNRPKTLNALSDAMLEDVLHATHALDSDDSIRCLVLTGSSKAFAAGADISEMQSKTYEQVYGADMFSEWQKVSKLRKPIIAAVSGYCLGGGCEIAMMCDLMVCPKSIWESFQGRVEPNV